MTGFQLPDHGTPNAGVNGSTIRTVVLWSLITVVAVSVLTLLAYNYSEKLQPSETSQTAASGMSELLVLRRVEDSVLTTYQLVDKDHKVYRIPIERAMELIAAESTRNDSTR